MVFRRFQSTSFSQNQPSDSFNDNSHRLDSTTEGGDVRELIIGVLNTINCLLIDAKYAKRIKRDKSPSKIKINRVDNKLDICAYENIIYGLYNEQNKLPTKKRNDSSSCNVHTHF